MAQEEQQAKRFIETLMADFKLIHNEAKKKFPAVKEVNEFLMLHLGSYMCATFVSPVARQPKGHYILFHHLHTILAP